MNSETISLPSHQEDEGMRLVQATGNVWSFTLPSGTPRADFEVLSLLRLPTDDGHVIQLRRPITVHVCQEDDGVHAESEALAIFGAGTTSSEAIEDFITSLLVAWDGVKDCADDSLTGDAIQLRELLRTYFP